MEIKTILNFLSKNDIATKQDVLLSELTSFKIGGKADLMVFPDNIQKLSLILDFLKENELRFFVMGKGSNLLCHDDGFRGTIIKTDKLCNVMHSGNTITAMAGDTLANVAKCCHNNSLTGFEFAAQIPGSIGGAIFMNAGAYGFEMKDIVTSVTYLDGNSKLCVADNKSCDFSYRTSLFNKNNYIIVSAKMEFKIGEQKAIKEKMSELAFRRRDKQPLEFPSAGSTFKRPSNGYASELIERCNLKGYSVGGAEVSTKHSGFIINKNRASFKDMMNLIDYVQTTVYNETGITLELEVKLV